MTDPRPADAIQVILDNPDLFRAVKKDLDRHARAMLKKQANSLRSAKSARALCGALGEELTAIALEGLTANQVRVLARRMDKHNDFFPEMATLDQRNHLMGLFTGEVMPEPARAKPERSESDAPEREKPETEKDEPPRQPLTEAQKIFSHKSMGARGKSKRQAG